MIPIAALAVAGADSTHAGAMGPVLMLVALGALSLAPFVILLMTSFVKIAIVLSILKSALGAPQVPPSQVITGLALILTIFIMAPIGERMYRAVEPELGGSLDAELLSTRGITAVMVATDKAKEPLREFLLGHASASERKLFFGLAQRMRTPAEQEKVTDRDFLVIAPAFLASELRRAFEIGFLIFIPFLVVDLVVSNLLVALGMNMLSPTTVSLPFKLLLFVMADGWQLLLRGLVQSYA